MRESEAEVLAHRENIPVAVREGEQRSANRAPASDPGAPRRGLCAVAGVM
jgi:hypothetical protein